jgi:Berberine and berberine like
MRLRLHALREVLAGTIVFPMSEATTVLQGYAELAATEPDELTTLLGIFPGPDGNPVLLMAPTWSGDVEYGTQVLEGFQRLGKPVFAQVAPVPYGEVLRSFDAHLVDGCHYAAQTRWLSDLTPQAISAFVDIGASRTAPHSFIFGYHFHGAPTRMPLEGTAFGLRREHFLIEVIAAWKPPAGDGGAAHKQWAWEASQRLAPFALPGGYPNILGPDEREQTAAAFGDNSARLKNAKRQFDPNGIFTSAISLPD